MRLIQLIFYFTLGYLLWKLVRSLVRSLTRTQRPASGPSSSEQASTEKPKVFRPEEIKDAEFEDITPPSGTSTKNSTH